MSPKQPRGALVCLALAALVQCRPAALPGFTTAAPPSLPAPTKVAHGAAVAPESPPAQAAPAAAAPAEAPASAPLAVAGPPAAPSSATVEPKQQPSIWSFRAEPSGDKFKIEASVAAIGDPVHETMTLLALQDAGIDPSASLSSAANHDFIRGVFWNDDPCAQLFRNPSGLKPSLGLSWYSDFLSAQKADAPARRFRDLACPLLGRSHFGDLQFLHGMADRDGVAAVTTHSQILSWCEIAYRLASGEVGVDASLANTALASLFADQPALTPRQLFRAERPAQVQARALGSILHVLQDSYAAGHTLREARPEGRGRIIQFYSFANQDHARHGKDDAWNGGSTDRQRVAAVTGGTDALNASAALLRMHRERKSWDEVSRFLRSGPLALSTSTRDSGPGAYAAED